jgi:putative protease
VKQEVYDKKTDIIRLVEEKTSGLLPEALSSSIKSLKGGGVEDVLKLEPVDDVEQATRLCALISSEKDIELAVDADIDLFYQLPNAMAHSLQELVALFEENPSLIPWFPAILIDKDYDAAVEFLERVMPKQLVTNNMGVAYTAYQKGLHWLAGPQINITNSFALKCLKEEFGCSGAFISNEISMLQMRRIVKPREFQLMHSIYHPNALLTSRQCLFQQSSGCKKIKINKGCLPRCEKHTSIINLNDAPYIIDKKKGSHNTLYGQYHSYNPKVVKELSSLYSHFLVDLTDVETMTQASNDKQLLIELFGELIAHQEGAEEKLDQALHITVNNQYLKGL